MKQVHACTPQEPALPQGPANATHGQHCAERPNTSEESESVRREVTTCYAARGPHNDPVTRKYETTISRMPHATHAGERPALAG